MKFFKSYNIVSPDFENLFKKLVFLVSLLSIIFFGIILRTKLYLSNPSLWFDEILLANNIIDKDFCELFMPLDYLQVAPPFFMVISKFLLILSRYSQDIILRDLVIRCFPFFCAVISLPLFSYFVHKVFKNKFLTLISTYMLAVNNTALTYSFEFKQYSTEMTAAIILLIAFFSINIKENSIKKTAAYSFLFCIAPWFSLSSFFILASGFLVILVDFIKEKFNYKSKILTIFLMFLVNMFSFYYFYLKRILSENFLDMQNYWQDILPSFLNTSDFIKMFSDKTDKILSFPFPEYFILFFILNLIILFSHKNYKIIILILLPVILCILTSFFKYYPYEQRLILFLLPLFIVIYSQFTFLIKDNKITFLIILIAILGIMKIQFQQQTLIKIINKSYARNLFLKLKEENVNPDNLFIVCRHEFDYYSGIYNMSSFVPDSNKINLVSEFNLEETNRRIEQIKRNEEYWLYVPSVTNDISMKNYFINNKNLEIIKIFESPNKEYEYVLKFKKI